MNARNLIFKPAERWFWEREKLRWIFLFLLGAVCGKKTATHHETANYSKIGRRFGGTGELQ
jgi:hypothetical protein